MIGQGLGVKHMKSKHFSADGRLLESALVPGYRWICVADGYLGGQPALFGKRVSVRFILDSLAEGLTADEVAMDFDLPLDAVKEAITFAADLVARKAV